MNEFEFKSYYAQFNNYNYGDKVENSKIEKNSDRTKTYSNWQEFRNALDSHIADVGDMVQDSSGHLYLITQIAGTMDENNNFHSTYKSKIII